jgi:hypothetical protein
MLAVDRSKYLQFVLTDPRHCGKNSFYTATDALLTLEAEVVKQEEPTAEREERAPKQSERLPVLEMLRKYGLGEKREHLLLAGKPGSGIYHPTAIVCRTGKNRLRGRKPTNSCFCPIEGQ